LKHNKIALSLIAFLRKAIKNKDSFSFAERESFKKSLNSFLELYASNNLKSLVQIRDGESYVDTSSFQVDTSFETERERTASEIGTGHIDDNRARINL